VTGECFNIAAGYVTMCSCLLSSMCPGGWFGGQTDQVSCFGVLWQGLTYAAVADVHGSEVTTYRHIRLPWAAAHWHMLADTGRLPVFVYGMWHVCRCWNKHGNAQCEDQHLACAALREGLE
jgi:hypothetical protein